MVLMPLVVVACGGGRPAAGSSMTTTESPTTTVSAPTTSTPTTPAEWTETAAPAGVGDLNDVTCPSVAECYAVGGMEDGAGPGWIIGSSDDGTTWRLLDTTPQTWYSAIACPTATTCLSVGGAGQTNAPLVLVTTDGGRQWAHEQVPAQAGALLDIVCASPDTCIAVPGIARTTDGGTTWSLEDTPTGFGSGSIDSVTCPTSSFCMIGGSGPGAGPTPALASVSDDAGASWSTDVPVGGSTGLGQISCVDAQHCVGLIGSDSTDSAGTGGGAHRGDDRGAHGPSGAKEPEDRPSTTTTASREFGTHIDGLGRYGYQCLVDHRFENHDCAGR